jgi:hypothetical protein
MIPYITALQPNKVVTERPIVRSFYRPYRSPIYYYFGLPYKARIHLRPLIHDPVYRSAYFGLEFPTYTYCN